MNMTNIMADFSMRICYRLKKQKTSFLDALKKTDYCESYKVTMLLRKCGGSPQVVPSDPYALAVTPQHGLLLHVPELVCVAVKFNTSDVF